MATSAIAPPSPQQDPATGGAPVTQQQTPSTPPSFGKNNRDLPQQLKDALAALVKDFAGRDLYDRRIEVLTDRILRFYDDGVQHIYPNYGTGVYQIGTAGGTVNVGNGQIECPQYMGAYNIFRARRRAIDAVLTQNPPGVDFQPDHPDRSEDIEAAETAEGYRHLFDQANDVRKLQQDISRMFELSGRCVTWTHTVQDQERWGLNDEGEARSMEVADVFGTLESKVPIVCDCLEMAPYAYIYKDPDITMARRNNPWLKKDGTWTITGGEAGVGESDWERFARLGVRQARKGYYLTGSALAHIVTEMHCFLRPAAFESNACDATYSGAAGGDEDTEQIEFQPSEENAPVTLRDAFNQLYPEGVHIVYIGKTYSESMPESMDDALDVGFPCERDGLSGGALMEPMKVIQDGFNDFKNAERENYEKGWPMRWFKGDGEDYDAIVSQRSAPGQFVMIKTPLGGADIPIGNQIFKEDGFDVPESFVACMDDYRGTLSQDITGALPALQGSAKASQTASGQAMDRSQAMGMLGPAWSNLQRIFAGIYKKAALAASKNLDHSKEITVVSGQGQSLNIQMDRLTRGSFHAHPDVDSTFPESTAAKRANLQTMIPLAVQSPVGVELFGSPDNWEELQDLLGFPELTLTPALAYRKQTRELEILLREAPVPNAAAVMQYTLQHAQQSLQAEQMGMPAPPFDPPPPMLPSIMPKKYDYHSWELKKCQEYLSSEDCWRQQIEGNEPGVQNVELHADAHAQMMAAMAPPPMPVMPPGKPAPKPGAAAGAAPEGNAQVQNGASPPGAPGQPTI